jgi:hypothetical protein
MNIQKNNLKKIINNFLNQDQKKIIDDFKSQLLKNKTADNTAESIVMTSDIINVLKAITKNRHDKTLDDFEGKIIDSNNIPKEILNIIRTM